MSEMVDRVARAIWNSPEFQEVIRYEARAPWTEPSGEEVEATARKIARAAIAAMREPTEAMLGAALDSMEDQQAATESILPAEVWRMMIDAALADD